jgi:hypothetical protein
MGVAVERTPAFSLPVIRELGIANCELQKGKGDPTQAKSKWVGTSKKFRLQRLKIQKTNIDPTCRGAWTTSV